MSESISFMLPLPSKELSPNSRVHWARKARAVKYYRNIARLIASQHRPNKPWRAAEIQFAFTFMNRRNRDRDNLLSSLKSAVDGFADAGIVANDSQFTFLPIVITDQSKHTPGVRVTIIGTAW